MFTLIWAEDVNHGIGINNKLPWNIKEEMKHFRTSTSNKVVVMGRKTFESIGRPLPNRENIVISRDTNFSFEDVKIYGEITKFINEYKEKDVWVIGGKSIYELFMPYADCLVVSIVKGSFECDTFMNKIDENSFHLRSTITNEEFDVKIYDRN